MWCSSAVHMQMCSTQMRSFCFYLYCTRFYHSCNSSSKGSPLDSSRLAAFPLGNRNTGCPRDCPCHHPVVTLFTSSHRLGGLTMRDFMIWGLEQLARGSVYAGDSEPSGGSYSTGAWEILKSRKQLPSLYSSSINCITHFLMIDFLCLATVKHLNCFMTLAMY